MQHEIIQMLLNHSEMLSISCNYYHLYLTIKLPSDPVNLVLYASSRPRKLLPPK